MKKIIHFVEMLAYNYNWGYYLGRLRLYSEKGKEKPFIASI